MITGTAKLFQNSEPEFLDNILSCNDYYARLFSNNLDENTPVFIECSFDGYASKKLDKVLWNPAVIEDSQVVAYYKDSLIWNCDDNNSSDIYGYYITNEANSIIWYYKFPLKITIENLQAIKLTLRVVSGCN